MFYICSAPPSPPVVDPDAGVSVAGIAAREGLNRDKGVGRHMAWQRLENGMGAEASNPQDGKQGCAAERAPLGLTSRENDKADLSFAAREAVGKASRLRIHAERLEKIESRRGNCMASNSSDLQDVVHIRVADRAPHRLTSGEDDKAVSSLAAREAVGKASRLRIHAERLENIESRSEICGMSEASDPQDMVHGPAADLRPSG